MISIPPIDDGAVNAIVACASPGVATKDSGAPAEAPGVKNTLDELSPLPASFTARRPILYRAPFPNANDEFDPVVITTGDETTAGLNAFHVVPLSVVYS